MMRSLNQVFVVQFGLLFFAQFQIRRSHQPIKANFKLIKNLRVLKRLEFIQRLKISHKAVLRNFDENSEFEGYQFFSFDNSKIPQSENQSSALKKESPKSQSQVLNILQIIIRKMKKGHRRTHSQTISISRPFLQQPQKQTKQEHKVSQQYLQFQNFKQPSLPFSSIQQLLQKSENNITQRILYIDDLQQPLTSANTMSTEEFTFGKRVNFKLNNFKLNMREIPQVPKSNQSTSHQGENKIQNLEKQLYFTYEHPQAFKHIKLHKQMPKTSTIYQKRTKTASTLTIKQISKIQKGQKIEKNEPKNTLLNTLKENPLKRPKLEYQTHKKNVHSFGGTVGATTFTTKIHKQFGLDGSALNDPKRKKKNYVI